jgi:hypothetical protein
MTDTADDCAIEALMDALDNGSVRKRDAVEHVIQLAVTDNHSPSIALLLLATDAAISEAARQFGRGAITYHELAEAIKELRASLSRLPVSEAELTEFRDLVTLQIALHLANPVH